MLWSSGAFSSIEISWKKDCILPPPESIFVSQFQFQDSSLINSRPHSTNVLQFPPIAAFISLNGYLIRFSLIVWAWFVLLFSGAVSFIEISWKMIGFYLLSMYLRLSVSHSFLWKFSPPIANIPTISFFMSALILLHKYLILFLGQWNCFEL